MATWLTHLRVAEKVSDKINVLDRSLFFAGSIAPDTNMPPDLTHWCIDGDKTTCNVQRFYEKYILNNPQIYDDVNFYWGYYIHLLTDVLWHKQKIMSLKYESKDIITAMKQKWKDVDNCFLTDYANFKTLVEMKYTLEYTRKYDNQWLDYYSAYQVKNLVGCILSPSNRTDLKIEMWTQSRK